MLGVLCLLFAAFGAAYYWLTQPAQPVAGRIDEGIAALEAGDIEQAYEILSTLRHSEPEDRELTYFLAVTQSLRGEIPHAVELLRSLPQAENDSQIQSMIGQFLLQDQRIGEARSHLIAALRIQPGNIEALRLLANLEANLLNPHECRRYIAAIDSYQQATAEDIFLYCAGDRARYDLYENLNQLQQAYRKTPEDGEVVYSLIDNLVSLNRVQEARQLLGTALGDVSQHVWRLKLAQAEQALLDQKFEQAVELLDKLPEQADNLSRTWIARGRALRRFPEMLDLAQTAFENAATLDPFDPEPVFALSQLLKPSQPERSRQYLQRSHALQAAGVQIEAVVKLESIDEAVERIPLIAQQLQELGAMREAYACLTWLVREGYASNFIREQLEELEQQSDARVALTVPTRQSLAGWPDSVVVDAGPQTTADADKHAIRFQDISPQTNVSFHYDAVQDAKTTVLTSLGGGVAVIDFDRDGFVDLFFPQGGPLPNATSRDADVDRMYRSLGNSFDDVTTRCGIGPSDYGHGATVADYNNDGFPDLYVTNYGANQLYLNLGDGTFEEVAQAAGVSGTQWSTSAAFGDLDADGDLDLYVVNYLDIAVEAMVPCTDDRETPCGPLNLPGQQDRVYENLGNGQFLDRTESSGVLVPDGKGLGVVIADLLGDDGLPEVFVGNDTTANFLFTAESGESDWSFRDTALQAGVAFGSDGQGEACMGIACGDVDENGHLDLFVSNFEGEDNTLYLNQGQGVFVDQTDALGLGHTSYQLMGWGSQFLHADADGRLDLVVLNGHLHSREMQPQLFQQTSNGFVELGQQAGDYFATSRMARGLAVLDLNRDRRPDLIATERVGQPRFLRNDSDVGQRMAVQLVGTLSNRDAIGTRVTLVCGSDRYTQTLHGGGGYLVSNEPTLFFSLGTHSVVDRIEVDWPNGNSTAFNSRFSPSTVLIIEAPYLPSRAIQIR